MNKLLVMMSVACVAAAAGAAEWKNVDDEHYLAGRKASAGYLQGKVVLVDRWGLKCPPCRAMLPRVEEIWKSYKTKQFVVLGGHCPGWGGAEGVKGLTEELGLTYPIYEGGALAVGEPEFDGIPFLYVVDETGLVVYKGRDDRAAIQAIVTAITDNDAPQNVEQWKRFLDYELKVLPGKAYIRMTAFKKKFPKEAKAYADRFKELEAVPDVKKLAELVAFAKRAKDMPAFDGKQQAKKAKLAKAIKDAVSKFAKLTESADARVSQEAKNSLADLKWAVASM